MHVVLLEFFEVPTDAKRILCVTQSAYEHVLKNIAAVGRPVETQVFLFGEKQPFDFRTEIVVPSSPRHTLEDIRRLTAFAAKVKSSYVFTPPNGDLYRSDEVLPGDENVLALFEFVRCLYARMLYFSHQPTMTTTRITTVPDRRILYVRGGGQHGTIVWGGASSVLRHATTPFEYFAGDSFGAAVAVMCALDPTGERLFFERLVETCSRMKLDEVDRPLNRDVAIEFVQSSLHEYIDRTLGELNLPVDIIVSKLSRGVEVAVLNRETTPDMKLGDALVASMSIPVVIGEHFGYFDGGLTAWDYVDGHLGPDSVVVGLSSVDMPLEKLQHFGPIGDAVAGIARMLTSYSGMNDALVSYKPYKQFCIPTRDTTVSFVGGSIGTTAWHVLNFQHGFDAVLQDERI